MIAVGCDVGSIFVKAVVTRDDEVAAYRVIRTTGNAAREIPGLIEGALEDAGASRKDVLGTGATGAGASLVPGADFIEDVITCVGATACFYLPEVGMCIDVGGQSITSMLLDEEGEVKNFMRNDKCASGSGRFIEVISDKLGIGMHDVDAAAARADKPVELSSQCGVFAESEVITHLNNGETVEDIIAGVCASVAGMVAGQARKFGKTTGFTVTGGVGKLSSVTRLVHEKLGGSFHPLPFDPQLAAAAGAALFVDSG